MSRRSSSPRRRATAALSVAAISCLLAAWGNVADAHASQTGAWWHLNSGASPTSLQPGAGGEPGPEGRIWVDATDLGWEAMKASEAHPIVLSDTVPEGIEIVPGGASIYYTKEGSRPSPVACPVSGQTVTCTVTAGHVYASEGFELIIDVRAAPGREDGEALANTARVSGGAGEAQELEALEATQTHAIPISSTPVAFGVERYELQAEDEQGAEATQAGSHPFQLTTTLDLRDTQTIDPQNGYAMESTPEAVRNLHFVLPPGLVGDINIVPRCSEVDFNTIYDGDSNACPAATAVGVADIKFYEPKVYGTKVEAVPVFNLVPAPGEPARFGIEFAKVTVPLTTRVLTDSSYAVEVSAQNISQVAATIGSQVTFWGVPGDPRHNSSRGWECLAGGRFEHARESAPACPASAGDPGSAFLTLPALCTQPETTVTAQSWPYGPYAREEAGGTVSYTFPSRLSGCEALSEAFAPSIEVEPETHAASTPSGLTVNVDVPQEGTVTAGQLGEADVAETTLGLPVGLEASPGAANGLQACSAEEVGRLPQYMGAPEPGQLDNDEFTSGPAACASAAKIGTATIETPLLSHDLEGSVYLGAQDTNLLEEKLVLYIVAQDPVSGVLVKLAGEVHVDPGTGQLISTFKNTPPVPFSKLTVRLFGGPRASQSTPPFCGPHESTASFLPSSGGSSKPAAASLTITSGPGGGPCPGATRPLAPSFTAGSVNKQAGAFTNFTLSLAHPDEDQPLNGISTTLPAGAAALLSTITPCPEPAPGQPWSCGPESDMGQATTSSGLGSEPITLGGSVYLTAGYDDAPFGLLVATEAKAGPFNLGMVYVRSRININPETAAVTVTTDPGPHGDAFPTRLKGIPVQLKQLSVEVNRPHFEFNGTDCSPLSVSGTLFGSEGGQAAVSSPFQLSGCSSLPFAPKLTASTKGKGSRTEGTSFVVKLESPGLGQANIRKVALTIPKALPARLETLKKACLDATFAVNPAACPKESVIGTARVHTPVLRSALSGPAYLVSHGNAAFPDVEFVLSGEGITLILDGKTDIKHGLTYSRFETAPDAPFTSFETELPAGPKSILGSYASEKEPENLCRANLAMPTEIVAQDGATLRQTTKVKPLGCGAVLPFKESRAQKLAKALKSCRKKYHAKKRQRVVCERRARAKYAAKSKNAHRKSSKRR